MKSALSRFSGDFIISFEGGLFFSSKALECQRCKTKEEFNLGHEGQRRRENGLAYPHMGRARHFSRPV